MKVYKVHYAQDTDRVAGIMTANDGDIVQTYQSATGFPSTLFSESIRRGEHMTTVADKFRNYVFVPEGSQDDQDAPVQDTDAG